MIVQKESPENEQQRRWPSEVYGDQLKTIIQADPLNTTREVATTLNVGIQWPFYTGSKLKGTKVMSGSLMS